MPGTIAFCWKVWRTAGDGDAIPSSGMIRKLLITCENGQLAVEKVLAGGETESKGGAGEQRTEKGCRRSVFHTERPQEKIGKS